VPIKGVSSEIIFNQMKLESKIIATKEQTLDLLKNEETDVVLTMGAGDIDRMAVLIIDVLKNKS
jgi:UDP-N-acetylmuramate--alanine ligase